MQAMPISNPSPANASSPAAATLLPFDPKVSSPFTAVFQAVLKGAGNSAKFPLAGKSQDSSREPARTTATGNNLIGLFPQGLIARTFAPILPEPSFSVVAAPIPAAPVTPDLAVAQGPAALSSPLPPEATSALAINSLQTSVIAQATAALTDHLPSTASIGNPVNTLHASALAQDLNAATAVALNDLDPQPDSNSFAGVSQDAAPLQSADPNTAAVQKPATGTNSRAIPTNAYMPVAAEQTIPIAPIADSSFVPQESGLSPNQQGSANTLSVSPSQSTDSPAVPRSGPQNAPTNGSNPPNSKAVQAARTDLSFLNMQTLTPMGVASKVSVSVTPQPATNQEAQSSPPPLASILPALPETLVHSVAKSAAVGASTIKFHENVEPPAANPASAAPIAAVPAKTPSQDLSNGSPGNNSNSKPESASKVAGARTDEKPFVQSLDTAAANPINGHSATADSTGVTSAVPVQAQTANSVAQPATPSSADLRPTEFLPTASPSASVVNAAHIVNQPGQTEIRIEMQADSLGGIELRAHIAGDQIGASISVEHHDAQVALATDLPALHSALIEKNLRVETLTVSHGTFSSLSGDSGHDHGQRGFTQSPAKFAYMEQPESPKAFTEAPAEWTGPGNSSPGLSVVA